MHLFHLILFVLNHQDNIGVFVDQNGKLLQDGRICWSEAPASVIINKPYALARLPRHIEVIPNLLQIDTFLYKGHLINVCDVNFTFYKFCRYDLLEPLIH